VGFSGASVAADLEGALLRAEVFFGAAAGVFSVLFLGVFPSAAEIGRASGCSLFGDMQKSVVVRLDGCAVTMFGAARGITSS
jgi:hypothetical protein